jgi:hypothetical protein
MEYSDTINPDQKAEIATVEANMKKVTTVEVEQFCSLFLMNTFTVHPAEPNKIGTLHAQETEIQ